MEDSQPPVVSLPNDESGDVPSSQRSKFACCDDIILLTQVNFLKPWEATYGNVTTAWAAIHANCAKQQRFGLKLKKAAALKCRFDLLMDSFVKEELASLRKSGVPEEYEEREVLLTDIKSRMDDFVEVKAVHKQEEQAQKNGIENSGLEMRRMAMGVERVCPCQNQETKLLPGQVTLTLSLNVVRCRLTEKAERRRRYHLVRQSKRI
jgi:hypothetical protein